VSEVGHGHVTRHTVQATGNSPTSAASWGKKGNPYSITKRRVLELIPVLGSQLAGDTQTQSTEGKAVDVNHKPDVRLPLLFTRPAVTPAQWV